MAGEKARGRRQHGADHERHHHGEKERLGQVEHRDEGDDKQADLRDGDDFRAADDRRLFAFAFM